jgi:hypothetical protein
VAVEFYENMELEPLEGRTVYKLVGDELPSLANSQFADKGVDSQVANDFPRNTERKDTK